jgi:Acetyltransferase (isoleucine patch superfamily)
VTPRNLLGFWRYALVRLRFPHQKLNLVFFDRGIDAHIGRSAVVSLGRHVRFMRDCTFFFQGRVDIGDDVFFNRGCTLICLESVSIGQGCRFGEMVSIHDEGYALGSGQPIGSLGQVTAPIVIGGNVWVGAKATVLRGVRIGDNSVIGANAVVTKDIPANVVAAGNPARVIHQL